MNRQIFLIGYMGTGKTILGKMLARRLRYDFLDLDLLVEQSEGMSINDIFTLKGEAYFRVKEAQALRSVINRSRRIIATGGGTPCFYNNMEWINVYGFSIYLRAGKSLIFQRLVHERSRRPLIRHMDEAALKRHIYFSLKERECFYKQAKLCINTSFLEEIQSSDLLIQVLEKQMQVAQQPC